MKKIEWEKKFHIGVEIIDKAHAKLFKIINKLIDLSNNPNTAKHTCKEMVKYLEAYSMAHFSEEEDYMRSIRYSGYARHKQVHDNFRDQTLVSLKKELERSDYSQTAVQHLIVVMQSWLTEHIMKMDQAIVKKAVEQKELHCSGQISLISRAVSRAMLDVFQTEVKLVNADYKGRTIGDGFYCYQCYDIESQIRLRLLLGVEKPLFLHGASRIYGKREVMHNDTLTAEAILPVFEPLFSHMGKFFQGEAEHELDTDNLLDKDAFRTDFMKGHPCSLLFGSKLGYFIFCYRTWRVKSPDSKTVAKTPPEPL
ncbi:MAG: hemerythrin family protein [Lachnospiraceae bacterium]|nr:hemerythrin family protein [Lachnospiraceae bacterium]